MTTFRFKVFTQYLWLALFVVLLRVVFRLVFDSFEGVTALRAIVDGLQLAMWVIGFGLLNAFLDFRKLLPRSPKFFKNSITALNIALTLAPEIARSVSRVRVAGRLRARRRGFRLLHSVIIPVLSNAIDQAIDLGDSMQGRGFGAIPRREAAGSRIEISNLSFGYQPDVEVLRSINLSIEPGQLVTISGNTGSGKSTLLKLIQSRVPGSVYVNQFPRRGFVADTVFDELAFGLRQSEKAPEVIKTQVSEAARAFGLETLLREDPQTMSAGWQQRVALAAGICSGSKVLLLDEPLSALDIQASEMFFDTLSELKRQKITVVIAEHRIKELQDISDSFFTIDSGNLTARFAEQANLKARIWPAGNVLAVLGSNGSGKTSLLRKLADAGGVLVPQPASDLLYLDTVDEELKQADLDANQPTGTAAKVFFKFAPLVDLNQNPRDLSEGQKLALTISIQLVKPLKQLLLDEPTLGFDTPSRQKLADAIFEISKGGIEVIVATHDLEFATAIANRTEHLQPRELEHVG